jgi:hypothetical protein
VKPLTKWWASLLAVLGAALAMALLPGAASAAPSGIWAPFDNCPLDDPRMQDPNAQSVICLSATTNGGWMQIGRTPIVSTDGAPVNVQFGIVMPEDASDPSEIVTVSQPDAIRATPVPVPGGLLGLAGEQAIERLLGSVPSVLRVHALVEQAGPIRNFDLLGALTGTPVFEMPVKIHLLNPILGDRCYIGSEADPIILRPQWGPTDPPPPNEPIEGSPGELGFDNAEGVPPEAGAGVIKQLGATMVDNTFSVPKARNCGPVIPLLNVGLLDAAINQRQTLPQQSGANTIVMEGNDSYLGGSGRTEDQTAYEILRSLIEG